MPREKKCKSGTVRAGYLLPCGDKVNGPNSAYCNRCEQLAYQNLTIPRFIRHLKAA